VAAYSYARPAPAMAAAVAAAGAVPPADLTGNTEQVGWLLYTSYLIPFEIASMLLLVAMIGAIVLAKREL
jgi:NADH-quinone oxidoreductase subunit J